MKASTLARAIAALREAEALNTLSTPRDIGRLNAHAIVARLELERELDGITVPTEQEPA